MSIKNIDELYFCKGEIELRKNNKELLMKESALLKRKIE